MRCPECKMQLTCRMNGVQIFTNSKHDPTRQEMEESYLCNGDLWECSCGYIFVDGINKEIGRPVAVIKR